ncbi:acyltransferase family protein [Spirosoma flavum]|uniref:Acyltransferase family protein n=1 Tax=Spirosoma flavum TaxID=2048557 RepID=A0ABW6ASD5_9BACT
MNNNSRIKTLDSLRGLAALTVVIAHVAGTLVKGHTFDEYTPLYLFRAAHESVIFFFLLSGYVLTYQVYKQNYFNYKEFIFQRFFRIYIPYLIIIIITFILFFFFHGKSFNSVDKNIVWGRPLTFNMLKDHFLLIGNFNTNEFNPVIWSLVHEFRVAIIFPILLFIISFRWKNVILISLSISFIANLVITFNLFSSEGYNNSYIYTLHYFSIFIIGALLAKHSSHLIDLYLSLTRKRQLVIFIFLLMVFNYSRMLFLIPHKLKLEKISLFNEIIADWFTAFSASYFIIMAIQIKDNKHWLLSTFPLKLGKISYSLYLIHVPIMLSFFYSLLNFNKIAVILLSVIISIVLAFISSNYIEKPSALFGKRLVFSKMKTFFKLEK